MLLKEKLLSIPSHLANKHKFAENTEYKECVHGDLGDSEAKPWLKEDRLVFDSTVLNSTVFKFYVCRLFPRSGLLSEVTRIAGLMIWV